MNYPSFKEYLQLKESKATLVMFRFNPPNHLHEQALTNATRLSEGGRVFVFASPLHDQIKNPIPYSDKVKLVRKTFPKFARSVIENSQVKTITDAAKILHKKGVRDLTVVINESEVEQTKTLLEKTVNGFDRINVLNGIDNDPDSLSAEMRSFARENNFIKFSQKLPSTITKELAKESFESTRSNLLLNEFRTVVDLPVDSKREDYRSGNLFKVGDKVIITSTQESAKISMCGTNYVLLEMSNGKKSRKWITDIEPTGK